MLSCFVCTLTLFIIDSSSFEIKQFLHKLAMSLKSCRVKQHNHPFLANWSDWTLSSDYWVFFLGFTTAFGRSSASIENYCILLLCLTMPTRFLSVLSKTQFHKAFSLHAGALSLWHAQPQWVYRMVRVPRKKWTAPQLTGVYGMVRVPRDLDSSPSNCPFLVEFLTCFINCFWILSVHLV